MKSLNLQPANNASLLRRAITCLLEIKDSEIRMLNLHQCEHSVDKAIHIGGASSAVVPMVSLFYGGVMDLDIGQPTAPGQDIFVLSKGHAVATLASIYADLGYFDMAMLKNSRSLESALNGHPGPLLPGVQVATGPMGQGMGVAQGFAIAGQQAEPFDVYTLTGDGELQEGPIWEAVMYAGYKRLENLCVLIDNNGGQLDVVNRLHFPYHNLADSFSSFGWRVMVVDATRYHTVYGSLLEFKHGKRDGRPTAIICKSTKGHGGFSDFMNTHKTSITTSLLEQESNLQQRQRAVRATRLYRFLQQLPDNSEDIVSTIRQHAAGIGLAIDEANDKGNHIVKLPVAVKTKKAPPRNKKIGYPRAALPTLEKGKAYQAHKVVDSAMRVFARDQRVVSVDADLASTSGLQAGIGYVDKSRALNVGVAEANMMLIGEAFGALGYNTWISTFCPFYDWKVLRRIAVGYQERLEVIADPAGWLSEGHGIDLTMLATAADLETQSNGATHMGNDDALLLNQAAHIKIINISCPRQLLAVMEWIMEGDKGIVYARLLRAAAPVIYDAGFKFEFGKAYSLKETVQPRACLVSSGRGVYEALEAARILESKKIDVNVLDMPSLDREAILQLYRSGMPVFIAEQNNGYLWSGFRETIFASESHIDSTRLIPVNTTVNGELHYIHSGTYAELSTHYGLDGHSLSERILKILNL